MHSQFGSTDNEEFRTESETMQLKLTTQIDQVINNVVVKYNLHCFAFSRELKLAVINQITLWNLRKDQRPKNQAFLQTFQQSIEEKLHSYAKKLEHLPPYKEFLPEANLDYSQPVISKNRQPLQKQQASSTIKQQNSFPQNQKNQMVEIIDDGSDVFEPPKQGKKNEMNDEDSDDDSVQKENQREGSNSSRSNISEKKNNFFHSLNEEDEESQKESAKRTFYQQVPIQQESSSDDVPNQKKVCQILVCPICRREFYRQVSTIQHIVENHGQRLEDGTFQCIFCEKKDSNAENLSFHISSSHTFGAPQKIIDQLAQETQKLKYEGFQ